MKAVSASAASKTINARDSVVQTSEYLQPASRHYREMEQGGDDRQQVYQARQIMSSPVLCLPPDASLEKAWREFHRHRFHHMPVVDGNGVLQGIVSDRDILLASSEFSGDRQRHSIKQQAVKTVMRSSVLTADPSTAIRELAEVMSTHKIGSVLILSEERIVGIVTRQNILQTVMTQAALELWT